MSEVDEATAGPPEGLFGGDRSLMGLLVGATLGVFAVQLDFFSVQAAIPRMAEDLDSTPGALQWVVSGYMLSTAAFLIVAGRLADIFGRRGWLIAGAAVFGGASLVGGAATGPGMLIAMRLLMGIGAAVLFPVSLAIVTNAFPPAKVQRAVGLVFALGAIAQALGPVLGGVVTDALTWRWVLWLNVPVAVVVMVLAMTRIPDSRDETVPRAIDWGGLALVVVSIASFTYGIDRASDWGWSSAATLVLIAGGAIGLAIFVGVERRVRYPLLDLTLFKNRVFSVMTTAGSVGNAGAVIVIFYSMVYLQDVEDFSAIEAGVAFLSFSAGFAIAAIMSGRMESIPPWLVMATALAVGGLATAGMGLVTTISLYLLLALFSGLGFGIAWSYTSVVTQSVVPPHLAGAASGAVLTVLVSIGGIGLAVATTAYDGRTTSGASNEADVIRMLLLVTGIIAAAVSPIVVLLGRGRHHAASAVVG